MIDYDPHDWRSHLLDIRGSVARQIALRVLVFSGWAVAVQLLHFFVLPVAISSVGHTLVGVALGLLLVFRTNTSYDRFWEGRKQWGAVVNTTRSLARAASVYLAADPALAAEILRWTAAYPVAMMNHLRREPERGIGLPNAPPLLELPSDALAAVLAQQHRPLAVARRITDRLALARQRVLLSDILLASLDDHVRQLLDCHGACERIANTPLPFAYVVHLRRCLLIYCATLPFALLDPFGWESPLAVALVAYMMLGIDEIGVEVENPFERDDNDLPLERFCATINSNLDEVLRSVCSPSTSREKTGQALPPVSDGVPAARHEKAAGGT